jgi:hypothetical protein
MSIAAANGGIAATAAQAQDEVLQATSTTLIAGAASGNCISGVASATFTQLRSLNPEIPPQEVPATGSFWCFEAASLPPIYRAPHARRNRPYRAVERERSKR